jgi:hypothetical protein
MPNRRAAYVAGGDGNSVGMAGCSNGAPVDLNPVDIIPAEISPVNMETSRIPARRRIVTENPKSYCNSETRLRHARQRNIRLAG